jgi:hypothetical protein
MSNCNAWDQQSQRQINVKECFAYHDGNGLSLLLIHALKGGTIRFAKNQLAEGLGLFLNVVRHLRTLTDLSAQAAEKFRPRHLQIFRDGVDLDFAGKIAPYQVG